MTYTRSGAVEGHENQALEAGQQGLCDGAEDVWSIGETKDLRELKKNRTCPKWSPCGNAT